MRMFNSKTYALTASCKQAKYLIVLKAKTNSIEDWHLQIIQASWQGSSITISNLPLTEIIYKLYSYKPTQSCGPLLAKMLFLECLFVGGDVVSYRWEENGNMCSWSSMRWNLSLQLMFLSGVALTIGPGATLRFFSRRKNWKVSFLESSIIPSDTTHSLM